MSTTECSGETIVARHKAVFTFPPGNTPFDGSVDGPLMGNGDLLAVIGGRTGVLLGRKPPGDAPFLAGGWRASRLMPAGDVTVAPYFGLEAEAGWEPVPAGGTCGPDFVDVHSMRGGDGIVYVARRVEVPEDGERVLHVGHDGGVRVFLDGEPVAATRGTVKPAPATRTRARVHLTRGTHELCVALDRAGGDGWGIFASLQQGAGCDGNLRFHINKNDLWILRAKGGSMPQPLAILELSLPQLAGASWHVEQDLLTAVTTGRFEKDGCTLRFETGVLATENLLWLRLQAEGGSIAASLRLTLPDGAVAATHGRTQVVERRFDKDVTIPAAAACAAANLDGGDSFTIEPGRPVLLAAAVCSAFDRPDYRAAAIERVSALDAAGLADRRTAHEAWWRRFWNESFVEVPDKTIEQRYYLSNYVLASASRAREFPPGLFGWVTTDQPEWLGDYHMNYNHVAPFYGLYAGNHIAAADPCHDPILANIAYSARCCREELGIEGLYQPVGIGPRGAIAYHDFCMQKSNASYSCVSLAFRWYATCDLEFARQAYPFVRATAVFWENWLAWEDGRYVIYNDAVHEGTGGDVNPVVSLGLVRMVMDLAVDMSAAMAVDGGRHEKWRHIREHVSDYPTCTVRDLPAEFQPAHLPATDATLDLPIFRLTEKGTPWWRDNTVGIQHIYPAGGVGLDSPPDLLARARNQIRVLNRWIDKNGMNSIYAAAAWVGYDPRVILAEMKAMLAKKGLPNGMLRGQVEGMEHQSIVPNALQEMLLQSHEGVLRLFPCWPGDLDARFGSLRARGAFLVWAELRGGQVCGVRLASEKGRPCTLANPWPGRRVRLVRDGKSAQPLTGERLTFNTGAGEHLVLEPA